MADINASDVRPFCLLGGRRALFGERRLTQGVLARQLLLIIIAFFLPPVTAILTDGCSGQFILNLILTILGIWAL